MKYKLLIRILDDQPAWNSVTSDEREVEYEGEIEYEREVEYDSEYALRKDIIGMGINGVLLDSTYKNINNFVYYPPSKIKKIEIIPIN